MVATAYWLFDVANYHKTLHGSNRFLVRRVVALAKTISMSEILDICENSGQVV